MIRYDLIRIQFDDIWLKIFWGELLLKIFRNIIYFSNSIQFSFFFFLNIWSQLCLIKISPCYSPTIYGCQISFPLPNIHNSENDKTTPNHARCILVIPHLPSLNLYYANLLHWRVPIANPFGLLLCHCLLQALRTHTDYHLLTSSTFFHNPILINLQTTKKYSKFYLFDLFTIALFQFVLF